MSRSIEIVLTVAIWATVAFLGLRLLIRWLRRNRDAAPTKQPVIVRLDAATLLAIREAAEKLQFIQALKLYKDASGQGLAESRDAVNYLMKNGWQVPPDAVPPALAETVSMAQVEALIARDQLIEAIKLYRQLVECDLKTAKDAVEALAAKRKPR